MKTEKENVSELDGKRNAKTIINKPTNYFQEMKVSSENIRNKRIKQT